jgi:hypothetical protein
MFIPNTTCDLYVRTDTADNFGNFTYLPVQTVKCAMIDLSLIVQKSSVRADTSGSRGQVEQQQGDAMFLFPKTVSIKLGDVIFKDGFWLEAIQAYPRRNLLGRLDHYQVTFWKADAVA